MLRVLLIPPSPHIAMPSSAAAALDDSSVSSPIKTSSHSAADEHKTASVHSARALTANPSLSLPAVVEYILRPMLARQTDTLAAEVQRWRAYTAVTGLTRYQSCLY